jgi:hypothetical protein
MGRVAPAPPAAPRGRHERKPGGALRRDEVLVLQFLQDEI